MIDLDTLIRPTTSTAIFEKFLDMLEAVKIPARSWRKGSVARSILGALAETRYQESEIARDCIRGMFLLLARKVPLTAHAEDVYGVIRIPATFASGTVRLTNEGGAVYSIGANELVVRCSSDQSKRFRVTEAFTLPGLSSIEVAVQAIESGAASSAAPEEIDEFETPLARVTVSNPAAIVGADAESDDALVERCLAKRGTWSPLGPRDAYVYAALSATLPDGSPTSISRVSVSRFSSTGTVTVVCATPSGVPTLAEINAVRENVDAKARPDTVAAEVYAASPKATSHAITVWCRGGVKETIEERAQAAMIDLIASYPIGGIAKTEGGQGYLFADKIAAAIVGSSPEIFDVDGVGADIALASYEIATNTTIFDVRIV